MISFGPCKGSLWIQGWRGRLGGLGAREEAEEPVRKLLQITQQETAVVRGA